MSQYVAVSSIVESIKGIHLPQPAVSFINLAHMALVEPAIVRYGEGQGRPMLGARMYDGEDVFFVPHTPESLLIQVDGRGYPLRPFGTPPRLGPFVDDPGSHTDHPPTRRVTYPVIGGTVGVADPCAVVSLYGDQYMVRVFGTDGAIGAVERFSNAAEVGSALERVKAGGPLAKPAGE